MADTDESARPEAMPKPFLIQLKASTLAKLETERTKRGISRAQMVRILVVAGLKAKGIY